jgi:type 1 glutamine amidotransferase
MKLLSCLCVLLLVWSGNSTGRAAAAAPKLKVLVVTGGHGFEREPFFKMFADNAEIEFTPATHAKTNATVYEREDLLGYDVVVLYDMPQNITELQKEKFLSLFDKGIGLVVLHHALVSYQNWPEYEQIIGGRYQEPDPNKGGKVTEAVGWEHDVEVPVVIVATNHPVTAGVKDFTVHDEIYWGFRVGSDVTPLITTTHPKSGKPLAWTRQQGKSRVMFLQLGHGPPAFTNENYRRLLAQGIRWAAQRERPRVFLLDGDHLAATKQRIAAGDASFALALEALREDAAEALRAKPVSVLDKKAVPPSGDKHDYLSLAPYFWPNPATSNSLPYVRRDGERNPEIQAISDHGNILGMPEKVETLALAYYFTGEEKYAAKATEFIRTWFLDPATRMNPHFTYAQAVRGVNTGRGIGLIESRNLVKVVDGVGLLAGANAWTDAEQRGLEQWFGEFLDWMLASQYGRDEAAAKNNHGTYYDVQVASFGMFLGRWEFATKVLQAVKAKRIAAQIEPDGRQPLELARTKAWSYSTGNLSGLMSLAQLGENVGLDLWNYETADGRGLRAAFDFLTPFALGEKAWPYQQLGGWSADGFSALARRAALKFRDPQYGKISARINRPAPASRGRLLLPPVESAD